MQKTCSQCGITKDINKFYRRIRSRDGHTSECKACNIKSGIKYQKNHRNNTNIRAKRCYQNHKKEYSAKSNQYNKNHRSLKTLYMQQYRAKNSEKIRLYSINSNLMRSYGITMQQKEKIILNQNNKCLSCGTDLKQLAHKMIHIDHDHFTNKIRGVLCHNCNTTIGLLNEDLNMVDKIRIYIEKYCLKSRRN